MTWLKTDDRFPNHRKVRRLSDGAYRLHHTALSACAHDETDGVITEADIADMQHGERLRKYVPALVEAGLWEIVGDSWVIHDFLDYNPSHDQQEAKRANDRERQAKWRNRRTDNAVTEEVSQRDDAVSNALVEPLSHDPVPSRPDPSLKDPHSTPVEDRFDEFWKVYPRKVSKKNAQAKWAQLMKRRVDPDRIISGAKVYARAVASSLPEHIKHPDGWLNGERWEDDVRPIRPAGASGQSQSVPHYGSGPWISPEELDRLDGRVS